MWGHLRLHGGTPLGFKCGHYCTSLYFVFQKKTITDVLASSEPKPGCPADLQGMATLYFSDKRSVIEQEELALQGESDQVLSDSIVQ